MKPFFEWDGKVLPLVIDWFEKARSIEEGEDDASIDSDDAVIGDNDDDEMIAEIGKRKLDCIYQFIRAMPEMFEPTPSAGEKRKRSGQLVEGLHCSVI